MVARELARVLLCEDPRALGRADACDACAACRRLDAGSHPDLHCLTAEGASVGVAQVRSLLETLSYQAFERGRKVAIIPDAFRMTREAANALLKTLEEPTGGTHIVLLTHHRNQLLPTLVSRCQCLRFDPIAEDEVRRLLEIRGVEPDLARSMAEVSDGCPGTVCGEDPSSFALLEGETADLWENWSRRRVSDRMDLTARWASQKDRLPARLDSLERHIRRRLRREAQQGRVAPDVLDTLEGLFRIRRLLEQNVNTQLALDALFLGLAGRDWDENP